jgi:protein ImuB
MLWATLHFPRLAIDALLRTHSDASRPIALITGPANQRILLDVNDAAFAYGLRAGQNLNTAWTLLSDFTALPHSPKTDQQLQQLLLQWAYQYSAMVYADTPENITLEIQASLALFGPLPQFIARLQDELTALNVRAQIAVAPSAAAAIVLAKNNQSRQAVMVTQWPALTIALKPIALAHAALNPSQQHMLAAMGIRNIGSLLSLPRDGLTRRLGVETLCYLDQLCGRAPEVHNYFVPPDSFSQRIEFHFELQHVQALLFPLRRMLGDLSVFLRSRHLGVQQFVLHLAHQSGQSSVTVGLLNAENDAAKLFDLIKLKLDDLQLPAPVRALVVSADQLIEFDPSTKDLFNARASALSFESLRERIRIKLGHESIYQLQICADPRPEYSQKAVAQRKPAIDVNPAYKRPSWLLPRAIPLRDVRVEILSGPERIESGWWDGADVQRDYYIVRTSSGQTAWAFRPTGDLSSTWMLQGWFS